MKAHNLQSNFAFIKSLNSNKSLGTKQFNFIAITPKEIDYLYRAIQYKKDAAEYQIGIVKSNKIRITEYKNGKPLETIKYKIR
jgi:hypothetical protein